ncbi:MAG: hypothetical protein A3K19_32800 [Lentisphaerae bacterium RIFOXYB12_FULL_65_16]|nr:MAG: hypothetical protein A3K18_20300 [Lentisphaerae bacterium RIFOXYA12_64_32]OGV84523.1 MAG: hypothetical protein A3K19_32800 [Lentisphaerae bacterium RIFOXYB12_FULL_65_16]
MNSNVDGYPDDAMAHRSGLSAARNSVSVPPPEFPIAAIRGVLGDPWPPVGDIRHRPRQAPLVRVKRLVRAKRRVPARLNLHLGLLF